MKARSLLILHASGSRVINLAHIEKDWDVWQVQWKRGRARDPVCGMYVDPKIAVTKSILGTTYYFCNQECADKFETETSVGKRDHHVPSTS